MKYNIFAFAIPFFLFFIVLEYYIAKRKGLKLYSFSTTIANLNVGVAERLIDSFTAGGFYFFYAYLHKHFAIFDIKPSILLWIALLLATDFIWYWYHRFGHEINLFWGFHVVHHSSEEFNYSAATRITIFQAVVRTLFWSILPVIGFPPHMISILLIVHGVYPFFTHTQLIGKLGILEYIIVTPTHHSVHHASNEVYLDKNYGDMFIIWDKLFGTFAEKTETPVYGLTKQLESKSFLWQHFHFLFEIAYAVSKKQGLLNKLKVIFGSPIAFDPEARSIMEHKILSKYKVRIHSNKFKQYVFIQMGVMLLILFIFLLFEYYINIFLQTIIALTIIATLINCGAILEQRRWVFYIEFVRVAIVSLPFIWYFPQTTISIIAIISLIILSLDFDIVSKIKVSYLRFIYGHLESKLFVKVE
ncbi:fatty acid hydroxylase [Emticicia oligotrophica DSM 17448]|uniref:Fatty acid hydroxylase n=1 Tax=Emticicia oligotrophica (strain DSM 17448 / CIP 109782 / MTCC 6937 / GPTSA100-15) TaxID=929562 RepID=A0ABN4AEW2_EMTOG|nr:sterol desaturase family protein [Emticicia oligotrophica]AFK01609.1 fatty acid hydroxylase [Emticicia oligotrophica DSM 17448]